MKRNIQGADDFNLGSATYLREQIISLLYKNSVSGRVGRICRRPDEI